MNCKKKILGFLAHFINLTAKAGTAALGCLEEKTEGTEISTTKMGSAKKTNGTNCAPASSITRGEEGALPRECHSLS
jgi:hypothetical protein